MVTPDVSEEEGGGDNFLGGWELLDNSNDVLFCFFSVSGIEYTPSGLKLYKTKPFNHIHTHNNDNAPHSVHTSLFILPLLLEDTYLIRGRL